MKKSGLLVAATLLFLALSSASRAATVNGTVFCDANQNGIIDTGDVGIPGVVVVITNQNNSFSNSAVTTADGSFSIEIPNPPAPTAAIPSSQIFIETLEPTSLPEGSSIVIPTAITNVTSAPAYLITFTGGTNLVFTSGSGQSSTGDWLINNPNCGSVGNCRVSGNGRIGRSRTQVDHIFTGRIVSGSPPSGSWSDTSRALGLQFTSTSIQSVICGTGSIQFSGTGNLSGRGVRFAINPVQFTVAIQNTSVVNGRRTRTVQAYYLNITTSDGTTLVLVSTDPQDPTDIAPVVISQGNLRLVSGD